MQLKSDEDLFQMYQNGSAEAFDVLYLRLKDRVYSYVTKRVHSKEVVAEIFQEVFMRAHKTHHLYNPKYSVLNWVYVACRSVVVDHIREQKTDKRDLRDYELMQSLESQLVEPEIDQRETARDTLVGSLESLSDQHKKVLTMRYLEEKEFAEIAELLKLSESNVRQIVSRAIQKLKTLIQSKRAGT